MAKSFLVSLAMVAGILAGGSAFAAGDPNGGGNTVPEPGTLPLIALAIVGGVLARNRRR